MWQRLKCQPTQFGDNKHRPGGRYSHRKQMTRLFAEAVHNGAIQMPLLEVPTAAQTGAVHNGAIQMPLLEVPTAAQIPAILAASRLRAKRG